MNITEQRKVVLGFTLCADPVRESCFHVAQTDEEMTKWEGATSEVVRREKLHRHMNNETGAMEIAAQCLVDFPDAPWDLRMQLARQTSDESRHVSSLYRRLKQLGGYKGEFPIGNFEWCVTNLCDTLAARLAIQNRTFEAGQMDLLGTLRNTWRAVGDETTAEVLEHILADEINHVRFANQWIKRMVREQPRLLLKVAQAMALLSEAQTATSVPSGAGNLPGQKTSEKKGVGIGVNVEDRRHADFSDAEIGEILRQAGMSSIAEPAQG
jgi:bacterioferritin (cytochrome b1)